MERDRGGKRPDQKLTIEEKTDQGRRNWYERPHEELVKTIQEFIKRREQQTRGLIPPEELIHETLDDESNPPWSTWPGDEKPWKERRQFLRQIRDAWDALAYDRYEPGSSAEFTAGRDLGGPYDEQSPYFRPTIELSHPLQVRIIDALTDAVGIPHQNGQTRINITSERLRNWGKWIETKEYQDRKKQHDERWAKILTDRGNS